MNLGKWLSICVVGVLIAVSCDKRNQFTQSTTAQLDSLLLRGIEDTRKLDFELAQTGLTQLLQEAENQKSEKYLVLANLNLGNLYHHFNLQDQALKYFLQSLEIAEAGTEQHPLNAIYNNIGIIYARNKAHDDAIRYFQLALDISREEGIRSKEGLNLCNLGISLDKIGDETQAIAELNEASEIFKDLNDSTNLGTIENSLGNIFYRKGDYVSALQHFQSAISLIPQKQHAWFAAEFANSLGKTYLKFNAPDSTRKYVSQAKLLFEELDEKEFLIESNMILSDAERQSGNANAAIDYLEEALRLSEELLEDKKTKWVSERQMNYQFGKKENELELLRLDSKRQRAIWIWSAMGGTIILILLIVSLRTKIQNLRQKNIILEQDKKVIQLTIEKNVAYREKMEQDLRSKEELNEIERAKLQQEIDFRNRELVTNALHLVNKNGTISAIDNLLAKYDDLSKNEREKMVTEARNLLRFEKSLDNDWESFKLHFEEVHPEFFVSLNSENPELNSGDLRMCAYLRLDLNAKEIAKIFNISPDSVRKRKQRLRDKLNIGSDTDLSEWLRAGFSEVQNG